MNKKLILLAFVLLSALLIYGTVVWFWYMAGEFSLRRLGLARDYRVVIISPDDIYGGAVTGLKEGLARHDFIAGKNVAYHEVSAGAGNWETEAGDLLKKNPQLIYAVSAPVAAWVAGAAGKQLPIVFAAVGDPLAAGFIKDYSAPGTNLTGCTDLSAELGEKRLEIMKEAVPGIRRVAVIYRLSGLSSVQSIERLRRSALFFGLELAEITVADEAGLVRAIDSLSSDSHDAVFLTADPFVLGRLALLTAKARESGLLLVGFEETQAERGAHITYGANYSQQGRQCARTAAGILAGGNPANWPVQIPDMVFLTINLSALRAAGLNVSAAIYDRADRVIE